MRYVDPNDREIRRSSPEGLVLIPLTTRLSGQRWERDGTREYIRETQRLIPIAWSSGRTVWRRGSCSTSTTRRPASSTSQGSVYRADPHPREVTDLEALRRTAHARREVILAAGAFNAPQLLMLSGIGPADKLRTWASRCGLTVPVSAATSKTGTKSPLSPRCAVSFQLLHGLTFRPPKPGETPDAAFSQWRRGTGVFLQTASS